VKNEGLCGHFAPTLRGGGCEWRPIPRVAPSLRSGFTLGYFHGSLREWSQRAFLFRERCKQA